MPSHGCVKPTTKPEPCTCGPVPTCASAGAAIHNSARKPNNLCVSGVCLICAILESIDSNCIEQPAGVGCMLQLTCTTSILRQYRQRVNSGAGGLEMPC